MQTSQLRSLPSLGTGFFGTDIKPATVTLSTPKEINSRSTIRATYSNNFGPTPPVPPFRNNQQQNIPNPIQPDIPAPVQPEILPNERPSATAPSAPIDAQSTSARPPSSSSGLNSSMPGLNFPGSQIPGLPGSPRPKPGTPRPYDPTKQKSKVMEWLTPPPPPTELLQREHFKLSPTCFCTIYFGDLSKWTVDGRSDAVIAPANKRLNTGPAVNAVLFKAAGSRLLDATQRLPDVAPQGIKAEVGDAISTRAFNLSVSRVIHTVGPVYKKNDQTNVRESDEHLIKAYKSALDVARKENLVYLAFPPLSCRIYGYPYSEGAEVALKTLKENCEGFKQVDIVIRNIEGYEAFIDEANKVLEVIKEKKTIKAPSMAPRGAPSSATSAVETPPQTAAPPVEVSQSTATVTESAPITAESAPVASESSPITAEPPVPTPSQPVIPSQQQQPSPPPVQGYGVNAPPQYQNIPPPQQNVPPYQQNVPPYQRNVPPYQQNVPPYQQRHVPPYQQRHVPPHQQNMPPYQQNMPPYQQDMPPYQQNVPPYQQNQQYAPAQPPMPPHQQQYAPPVPPQQQSTDRPLPPHQQAYTPPPPPPPPESNPVPPRERASPYPPPNRPPRPPSSPTSTYNPY